MKNTLYFEAPSFRDWVVIIAWLNYLRWSSVDDYLTFGETEGWKGGFWVNAADEARAMLIAFLRTEVKDNIDIFDSKGAIIASTHSIVDL